MEAQHRAIHSGHGQIGDDQGKLIGLSPHHAEGFERMGLSGYHIAQPFQYFLNQLREDGFVIHA